MPVYLVHGFRWPRQMLRIYVALYDLENVAAECIVAPTSAISLLNCFYTLYDFIPPCQPPLTDPAQDVKNGTLRKGSLPRSHIPSKSNGHTGSQSQRAPPVFNDWSPIKLLEQYDPTDETSGSQPYAYVADHIVPIPLSASVAKDLPAAIAAYDERQRKEVIRLSSTPLASPVQTSAGHDAGLPLQQKENGPSALSTDTENPTLVPQASSGMPDAVSGNGTAANDRGLPSTLSERERKHLSKRLGWFDKLKDNLAPTTDIEWYIVVTGDEERFAPSELDEDGENGVEAERTRPKTPRSAGLKSFFGRKDKASG